MFIFLNDNLHFPATLQYSATEWIVTEPFWDYDQKTMQLYFVPPAGLGTIDDMMENPAWTTDYRSGWSFLDTILPKQGEVSADWITHDAKYTFQNVSRWSADDRLRRSLHEKRVSGDDGLNLVQSNLAFAGVRLGGGEYWGKHATWDIAKAQEFYTKAAAKFACPVEKILKQLL